MCNNKKGCAIWDEVKNEFEYRESNIKDCLQPALCKNIDEPVQRAQFWHNYLNCGFDYILKKNQISRFKLKENMLRSYLKMLIK